MFCVGFTKKRAIQVKRTCYAQSSQIHQKFIPESIGREIEKATSSIYPLQNVFIHKVKILKAPKFDIGKLMEVALGEMDELLNADHNADKLPQGKLSTKGVGATTSDMSEYETFEYGVVVPLEQPKHQLKLVIKLLSFLLIP
ncbi:40S ribosomal protein S3a-like protein [Tanacetum coccineum]|uniref:40S ribosomal protein S3a-like protein n=1 Tax=Tanacetum coccineum TaxID=301880 RepID=A0ABQ5BBW2_9ASTR